MGLKCLGLVFLASRSNGDIVCGGYMLGGVGARQGFALGVGQIKNIS